MEKIKVSIIVPIYNTELFLEECLDSLIKQSLKEIQIICVDDGSTDNSLEIAKKYENKDGRVEVYSQPNLGPSVARNKGLDVALGEYVMFIDSDDYISLDAAKSCFEYAKEDNLDVMVFNAQWFFPDEKSGVLYGKDLIDNFPKKVSDPLQAEYFAFFTNSCMQFLKLKFLNEHKIRFIEGIVYEDLDFCYNVLSVMNSYRILNEPFYFYRRNFSDSITTNNNTLLDLFTAFEYAKQRLENSGRWNFFEFAIYIRIISLSCEFYHQRKLFLDQNMNIAVPFFNKMHTILASMPKEYFNSIMNKLGYRKRLNLIRDNQFIKFNKSYKVKKFKIIKQKLGIHKYTKELVINLKLFVSSLILTLKSSFLVLIYLIKIVFRFLISFHKIFKNQPRSFS